MRTTLCLVERVIPASADPGRNTSLHNVRTFSGVRHSNAACTFSYINVPLLISSFYELPVFVSYVCLSYARVGAMFCVRMPTWLCEEYVLSTRARAHAMSHEAAAIMRCMRFNERAYRQIRENVSTSLQRYRFSERLLGNGGGG